MTALLTNLQLANQVISLLGATYTFVAPMSLFSSSSSPSTTSSSSASSSFPSSTLDETEMMYQLKWMQMFFDQSTPSDNNPYLRELYNLFVTIRSDYACYTQRKQYNDSLWILSSYREKNIKDLVKKIRTDIRMFHEGMSMFSRAIS